MKNYPFLHYFALIQPLPSIVAYISHCLLSPNLAKRIFNLGEAQGTDGGPLCVSGIILG